MVTAIIVVFALGYLAITLEHTLKIDKLIPAVAMMAICLMHDVQIQDT